MMGNWQTWTWWNGLDCPFHMRRRSIFFPKKRTRAHRTVAWFYAGIRQ